MVVFMSLLSFIFRVKHLSSECPGEPQKPQGAHCTIGGGEDEMFLWVRRTPSLSTLKQPLERLYSTTEISPALGGGSASLRLTDSVCTENLTSFWILVG